MTDHRDRCPHCKANLGLQAYEDGAQAGDEVTCKACYVRFIVQEHSDGSEDWFSFHRITKTVLVYKGEEHELKGD